MKPITADTQLKVKELRKTGSSHREIAKLLRIGVGTAFYYSLGIHLTKAQHKNLKNLAYKKGIGNTPEQMRKLASFKGGVNNKKNLLPKYSRDDLLGLLKNFYVKNRRIPTKRDFINMYGSYFRNFGTWNNAIREAGFSPNPVLFAKKYLASDGHKCDSLAEKIIDDWLAVRRIPHERNIPYSGTRYTADFKVSNTIIEFFGLHGQLRRYDELMKKKLEFIKTNRLSLIAIYPNDLFPKSHLDTLLKDFIAN